MSKAQIETYLSQKLFYCEKIFELTKEMLRLFEDEAFTELNDRIQKREKITSQINTLDSYYMEQIDLSKAISNVDMEKLKDILLEIQQLDEDLSQKILTKQGNLNQEYNQAKSMRKVRNSYEANSNQQGFFINRQR